MRTTARIGLALVALALGHGCSVAPSPAAPALPVFAAGSAQEFRVALAPDSEPRSGRLIVVAAPVDSGRADSPPAIVSPGGASFVAAQDAPFVGPAQELRVDADMLAFPRPFSRIDPGEYWVQVRLDVNHNAAYRFPDPENDYISLAVRLTLPSREAVRFTLQPEKDVVGARA